MKRLRLTPDQLADNFNAVQDEKRADEMRQDKKTVVCHPGATLLGDTNIAPRPEFKAGSDGIYTEIHVQRDGFQPVVFPDKCPACGAPAVNTSNGQTEWAIVEYACLGRYEPKPQIQTHTSKWWGNCRKH